VSRRRFNRRRKFTVFSISATASLPPYAPKPNAPVLRAGAPLSEPAAKAPRARRHCEVPALKPSRSPANVLPRSVLPVGLCDTRWPRSCASSQKFCPSPVAAILRRRDAPSKVQSQSPASSSAPHVCPDGHPQSPRAQTPRLACREISPRARPDAPVRWFFGWA